MNRINGVQIVQDAKKAAAGKRTDKAVLSESVKNDIDREVEVCGDSDSAKIHLPSSI